MNKVILIILILLISSSLFGQWDIWSSKPNNVWQAPQSSYKFTPEALQYFARYPVQPSIDTMKIIAEFIDSLVLNGVWAKLDVSVLCANRDTTSALLNMKGTSFTGISIGSPTFTPYKGFTPATNKYINSLFNPSTAGGQYTQNSASIAVYSNTDYLTSSNLMGLQVGSWSLINPRHSDGNYYYAINTSSFGTTAMAHTIGLYFIARTASNVTKAYFDTDSLGTNTASSTSLGSGFFYVGATNIKTPQGFSPREIPYYCISGGLSTLEERHLSRCLSRMLVKLGVDQLTRIVCDGNSLTGSNPNYVTKLQDTLSASSYSVVNKGIGGMTIEVMNQFYGWRISHLPVHKKNVLIFWEGTNAIQSTGYLHADSVYREMKRYGLQARATGKWDKIIVMTILPFGTNNDMNLSRDTLNSLLISHYTEFCDTIIDLCADSDIGQWGDQLNATFYTDKVHPTDAGQAIVMRMVYVALKNLRVIT